MSANHKVSCYVLIGKILSNIDNGSFFFWGLNKTKLEENFSKLMISVQANFTHIYNDMKRFL